MVGKFLRPGPLIGLAVALVAALVGCAGGERFRPFPFRQRSTEELKEAVGWTDPDAQAAGGGVVRREDLLGFAKQARESHRPPVLLPKKSVLVISGGGAFGAHPAGVLYGWTQAGTRPEFDAVTGVSTGALIAVFAFLGPSVDCELREAYTTKSEEDVYRKYRFPRNLFGALADNSPLERLINSYATDDRIRQVAAEHNRGRRLYVATTDLDVRRAVFWDMGAIAARDTPEDRWLFRKLLLASAAIPGFFPPVEIPVVVDGRRHVERHVDGGTTSSMFFAPPWVPPAERETLPAGWLYGSDLYILVAGKMYPDPTPVRTRTFSVAGNAVSTIIYDQTRSDLAKMFMLSMLTGMNYHLSVIPKDLPTPVESTSFDPEEMQVMFNAGAEWARSGPNWRITPPGYEPGEGGRFRAGLVLTAGGRTRPLSAPDGGPPPIPPVPPKK